MLEDLRKGLKLEEITFLYIKKYQKHVYVIIRDPTCLNLLWPVPAILVTWVEQTSPDGRSTSLPPK